MTKTLTKLRVTLEPNHYAVSETVLDIQVERFGKDAIQLERIIPANDFESHWDYAWNICKILLDNELKKQEIKT